MSSLTIESLAKLGRERRISPLLELGWMNGGADNPVATAMQIVENRRKTANRRNAAVALFVTVVTLAISAAGIAAYKNESGWTIVGYWVQTGLLLIAFFGTLYTLEGKPEEISDGAMSRVVGFCEHLTMVNDWWCNPESLGFYRYLNEDDVRDVGTNILINAADNVLRIQKKEKEAKQIKTKEELQVAAGNAMAEFSRRYNTLQRIGLASGGYEKYFEMAQRRIDSRK